MTGKVFVNSSQQDLRSLQFALQVFAMHSWSSLYALPAWLLLELDFVSMPPVPLPLHRMLNRTGQLHQLPSDSTLLLER
jgi:hypothetical protein